MLWLIWIAITLLVPVLAGVQVWFQINRSSVELPETTSAVGMHEARSVEA